MNVAAIAESVSAVTLVIGVGFAVVRVRQSSRQRRHEAVIELVQSYRTPQFTEALDYIAQLSPGISDADLRQRMGDKMPLVTGLAGTWEAFGILVFRGDIDIGLFEDFFSGPSCIHGPYCAILLRSIEMILSAKLYSNGSNGWRSVWPSTRHSVTSARPHRTSRLASRAEQLAIKRGLSPLSQYQVSR